MNKILKSIFCVALTLSITKIMPTTVKADDDLSTTAKSVYLADFNSETVIYSNNENERLPIASMTKIMLLNLIFENIDAGNLQFDEEITISENASGFGGSQVFLESNGVYTADVLIKSIVVASANDASVAMAERLYGSEEECVKAMNEKCKEWGLVNTTFSNCTGLPKPTQYSSAKDVFKMLKRLLAHKDYFNYSTVWMDSVKHSKNETQISNTNKLLKTFKGCDGGKTGSTSEAGYCIATTAKRKDMRLIAVVVHAKTSKDRFTDATTLLNYGFNNFDNKVILAQGECLNEKLPILNGKSKNLSVSAKNGLYLFGRKNVDEKVSVKLEYSNITAPVNKGEVIGKIYAYKNGVEVACDEIVAMEDVENMNYFDYVKDISEKWNIT